MKCINQSMNSAQFGQFDENSINNPSSQLVTCIQKICDNPYKIYPKQDSLIIQTESNELFIARYHNNIMLSIHPDYCWKLPLSTSQKYLISEGRYESSVLIMSENNKEMYHLYLNIQAMNNNFCELDRSLCTLSIRNCQT